MTLQFAPLDVSSLLYEGAGGGSVSIDAAGVGSGLGASGHIRLAIRGSGSGAMTDNPGVPITPSTGGGSLSVRVAGDGSEKVFGVGGGGKMVITGKGGGSGVAYGTMKVGIRTAGYADGPVANYAFYLKAPPLVQAFANYAAALIREDLETTAAADRLYAALVRSRVRLAQVEQGGYSGQGSVRDLLSTSSGLSWMRNVVLSEGLLLESEVVGDSRVIGRVISRMLLEGKASNYVEAVGVLKEALTLLSFDRALSLALVADSVELEAQMANRYLLVAQLIDRLLVEQAASGVYQMVALVDDDFVLATDEYGNVDMVALLREALGLTMTLEFDDGQYIAWVLNTESAGLTRYTNYPFNSFMRVGTRYFGVHHGGIVELVGDTDMGDPIAAKMRFGMFDFNDRHEKGFADAFIGVATDGTLVLKAIFVNQATGEKDMAIYKVNYRPSATARETRAQFGRGLRAVDWDFVLENVGGAKFDLSSIQFNPIIGARRTRG